ncbi:hypothetical protein HDV64DRAFT_170945 [Trichoderma sp. TUCIM 5745]
MCLKLLNKMRHRAADLMNDHPTFAYTNSAKQKTEEILVSSIIIKKKSEKERQKCNSSPEDITLRGRNRTADFLMRCYPLQSDAMNQLDHPEVEELKSEARKIHLGRYPHRERHGWGKCLTSCVERAKYN